MTGQAVDGADGLSGRGRRTRALLLESARQVFEHHGFVDARISDIASGAGVAHGTFYNYFESKEAIFQEILLIVQHDMAAPGGAAPGDEPWSLIEHANRVFVEAYQRNSAMMATLEQVVSLNADVRRFRREFRRPFMERNTRAIQRWQAEGLADPEIDARYAANALGAMVDRFMYVWLVIGEPFEVERATQTLTRLWCQALGLTPPPSTRRTGGARAAAARTRTAAPPRRRTNHGDAPVG